jgi:precorrin-2/cobalt-factor-2 C20-methyltransferase
LRRHRHVRLLVGGGRADRAGRRRVHGDPGSLPEDELVRRLGEADAAVVMKLGRHLPKVRRALERTGRLARAMYVARGTMPGAVVMPLVDKTDDCAPYFAVVLVPGRERRS